MKTLLLLSVLTLLLAGCGRDAEPSENSELMDQLGGEATVQDSVPTENLEEPYSVGPSEIPSDLIPNEE